jgi:hypothetical protein
MQDVAAEHGPLRVFARPGLYACHVLRTQGRLATLSPFLSGVIDRIEGGDRRRRRRVGFGGQLVAPPVRLETPFLRNFALRAAFYQ